MNLDGLVELALVVGIGCVGEGEDDARAGHAGSERVDPGAPTDLADCTEYVAYANWTDGFVDVTWRTVYDSDANVEAYEYLDLSNPTSETVELEYDTLGCEVY